MTDQHDNVNSPPHYEIWSRYDLMEIISEGRGLEVVDIIRARLTEAEFRGWCKGNALKYTLRAGLKDDERQDWLKAAKNIDWLAEMLS